MSLPRVIRPSGAHAPEPPILVPIKMRPDLRRRFRVRAVQADMTYAQLIEHWLDAEDRREARAAARQAHPLHRPAPEAATS
ncbi:hypothetical protein I5G62_gp64 [Mycobacterium phage CRB2]|uniref:Ribbon-helix-helix DNA binding domain protein n=1 Tax=Mycobacterium phage CRB2 TaxID=2483623 RepID=A0A455LSN4_9CAUD|nr:hypothetical protein I5G62_gp64 [Mycobacterium phage CRB2]AYP70050.1 hypothetical protein CRB2_64 [Mycobacterium phage CRB2]